jgi:hypothetical protein
MYLAKEADTAVPNYNDGLGTDHSERSCIHTDEVVDNRFNNDMGYVFLHGQHEYSIASSLLIVVIPSSWLHLDIASGSR